MTEETKVDVTKTSDDGKDHSQGTKIERTPEEIATYNLKKKADDAKALGLDPKKVLGEESNDEVPAWYKAEKAKEVKNTSLQMADTISDEDLKEKVKTNLGRIVPSDNPEEDFKLALGAASASKNKQVIEEISRYTPANRTASGGSQPVKVEEEFVPTEEEARFMKPPYNLTKEKILANRKS